MAVFFPVFQGFLIGRLAGWGAVIRVRFAQTEASVRLERLPGRLWTSAVRGVGLTI
jgi:hypothetical protein